MSISLQHLLAVTFGGALGAAGRYLLTTGIGHWLGHGFPLATMVVNISGSFALGVLIEVSALAWTPSSEVRAFLVAGVLGAFTTFSAFSLDAYALWVRGETIAAAGYLVGSVVVSIAALIAGLAVMRVLLS